MNEYRGSKVLALAAYNGGETNVNDWLAEGAGPTQALHDRRHPDPQTRAYVTEVLSKQHAYRSKYARQLGYT